MARRDEAKDSLMCFFHYHSDQPNQIRCSVSPRNSTQAPRGNDSVKAKALLTIATTSFGCTERFTWSKTGTCSNAEGNKKNKKLKEFIIRKINFLVPWKTKGKILKELKILNQH